MWPKAVQSVLGVYVDDKLSGVMVYGIGTRAQAATDIFEPDTMANNQLWELQRVFTTDEAKELFRPPTTAGERSRPSSLGSMIISRGNEYIRSKARTKDGKPVRAILSFADSAQDHDGAIYKATNAAYLGEQPPRTGWSVTNPETGETKIRTTIKKSELQKLVDAGFTVEKYQPTTGKHKYLYPLGKDQNERDVVLAKLTRPLFSYPKPGEKSVQVENPAKARIAARQQQTARQRTQSQGQQQSRTSNISKIKAFLRTRIINPETGGEIFTQTALRDRNHPAYQQARQRLLSFTQKNNIRINS